MEAGSDLFERVTFPADGSGWYRDCVCVWAGVRGGGRGSTRCSSLNADGTTVSSQNETTARRSASHSSLGHFPAVYNFFHNFIISANQEAALKSGSSVLSFGHLI